MKEWLEIVDSEYLSEFILAGGGSVKFVTGAPADSAEVSAEPKEPVASDQSLIDDVLGDIA
jgi:hypothetical protein